MDKEDKDFLRKLVLEKRFPMTEENTTEDEIEKVASLMERCTVKEIREVMKEADEEMMM